MKPNIGEKTRVRDYLDQGFRTIEVIGECFTLNIKLERFNNDAKYRKHSNPYLDLIVDGVDRNKNGEILKLYVTQERR